MSTQPVAPASKADLQASSSSGASGLVTSIWNGEGETFITVGASSSWLKFDPALTDGPSMAKAALVNKLQVFAALNAGTIIIYGFAIYAA